MFSPFEYILINRNESEWHSILKNWCEHIDGEIVQLYHAPNDIEAWREIILIAEETLDA